MKLSRCGSQCSWSRSGMHVNSDIRVHLDIQNNPDVQFNIGHMRRIVLET